MTAPILIPSPYQTARRILMKKPPGSRTQIASLVSGSLRCIGIITYERMDNDDLPIVRISVAQTSDIEDSVPDTEAWAEFMRIADQK